MKKICLIIPSLHAGGMERVMTELANYFAINKPVQIHLLLLSKQHRFYDIAEQIVVHEPSFDHHNSYFRSIKTFFYLRSTIRKISPFAVLSFGEIYNSFVLLSLLFLNQRIFVSDRSNPSRDLGEIHEFLRKILYKRASGIICQTKLASELMFARLGGGNIAVIGNPIKQIKVASQIKQNIILSVGRLIPSKQFDVLIKLYGKSDNDNWCLCIVGDGPERLKLLDLIVERGLTNKVSLVQNQKNLAPYFSKAKIFAFTSVSEGFPNVLGEAMRAGLAVVSYNFVAGASDLIETETNGFLVKLNDEQQFITKLNTLMKEEPLVEKFALSGAISTERFDIKIIGDKYYEFITS